MAWCKRFENKLAPLAPDKPRTISSTWVSSNGSSSIKTARPFCKNDSSIVWTSALSSLRLNATMLRLSPTILAKRCTAENANSRLAASKNCMSSINNVGTSRKVSKTNSAKALKNRERSSSEPTGGGGSSVKLGTSLESSRRTQFGSTTSGCFSSRVWIVRLAVENGVMPSPGRPSFNSNVPFEAANSSIKRVLPTPGSPERKIGCAAAQAASICAQTAPRCTNGARAGSNKLEPDTAGFGKISSVCALRICSAKLEVSGSGSSPNSVCKVLRQRSNCTSAASRSPSK